MIEYLQRLQSGGGVEFGGGGKGGYIPGGSEISRSNHYPSQQDQQPKINSTNPSENQTETQNKTLIVGIESDEEKEEDDEIPDIDIQQIQETKKVNRSSVSAEAFGMFNKKGSFVPTVIQKTDDQIKRINEKLSKIFMFGSLDEREKKIVVDAVAEQKYKKSDVVFNQYADGDGLYIIDKGNIECFRKPQKDAKDELLQVYKQGESFGELSLLYNAPRAATLKCQTDCVLFFLDRQTFNNIVQDSTIKKREKFQKFLTQVDLLKDLDTYQRMQLCDCLQSQIFQPESNIINEGDPGDKLYFLMSGECTAIQAGKAVAQYQQGEYFGERALVTNEPRAATVQTNVSCQVATLDRNSFTRLLGPLNEHLEKKISSYN